jgi:hypothetical protein
MIKKKTFAALKSEPIVTKPFTAVIYECWSLEGLSSLVKCLWGRPGAYLGVDHLKGASLSWARPGAYLRVDHLKGASRS